MSRLNSRGRANKLSLLLALAAAFAAARPAHGVQVTPAVTINTPCAWMEMYGGNVQVLDASRTRLLDSGEHTGIPCGGWVSVDRGWALISHRDGQKFYAGPGTFLEVPENNTDGHRKGDHVVLYKGEVYGIAPEDAPELRIATANARARLKSARGIVLFSEQQEDTQLICLERKAWLENRFQIEKKILVKQGEASSLNFKAMRVVPSTPQAVAAAPLRQRLQEFHVGDSEQERVLRIVKARQDRKFAALLDTRDDEEMSSEGARERTTATMELQRKPAGLEVNETGDESLEAALKGESAPRKPAGKAKAVHRTGANYDRHAKSSVNDRLMDHWTQKMVAGQQAGERMLKPDKFYGRPQKVQLKVEDKSKDAGQGTPADREKARLLEELSQIRGE
jgi:hypothetical protein